MPEMTQDLQTVARELRAKVLAGVELSQDEAAKALTAIRSGRRMAAESARTRKSSGGAVPRSASELLGALGMPAPK